MPRILLVEDNEMNRDMLSRRLRRKGFEVDLADDGPRGLDLARSGRFDLILMDLSLPGLDGWAVARELKADPATRSTPIIALTAHAMAGDRERAIEAGCDDYDSKPVEFPRLLAKIQAQLAIRNPPEGTGPTPRDDASPPGVLRHDMIAPLGRILGYCELLIEDAEALGRVYRAQSLCSIRRLGDEIRRAIDGALLPARGPAGPVDRDSFAPGVILPARSILRACDALEDASGQVPDRASFLEDLNRVRQDAALLIAMAGPDDHAPDEGSGRPCTADQLDRRP